VIAKMSDCECVVEMDADLTYYIVSGTVACCYNRQFSVLDATDTTSSVTAIAQRSVPESTLGATDADCSDSMPLAGEGSAEIGPWAYNGITAAGDASNMTTCPNGCPGAPVAFSDLFQASQCRVCAGPLTSFCRDGECVIPTCQDLEPACNTDSELGLRARQYCAETCGCRNVTSSLVLSAPENGCSPACLPRFQHSLEYVPCTDTGPRDPRVQAWLQGLSSLSPNWSPQKRSLAGLLGSLLGTMGCAALQSQFLRKAETDNVTVAEARQRLSLEYCGGTTSAGVVGPAGSTINPILSLCPVNTLSMHMWALPRIPLLWA